VSSLPGETVNDQDGRKIGEVKEIYAVGDDETPMWVTIESATGLGRTRGVFVPLARIKKQADEFRVPYSYGHIHESPEVEPGDEISEEDDRALRAYYAIGLADQELVGSAQSYASQVPDDEGPARKVDADSAEGPVREIDQTPPAERVAEAYEKQKEEEGEEHRSGRDTTAEDVFEEDGAGDSGDSGDSGDKNKDEDSEESKDSEDKDPKGSQEKDSEDSDDKSEEEPKAEEKQDRD
jgi:PRC-barrel domain